MPHHSPSQTAKEGRRSNRYLSAHGWHTQVFNTQFSHDRGCPSLHEAIAGEAILKCYTEETRQQFAAVIKTIIENTLTRALTVSQERLNEWVKKTLEQSIREAQNALASATAGFRAKLGGAWGRLLWACFGGGLVAAALLMAGGFWLGRNW